MTAFAVPMKCGSCGMRWEVLPKPDGSMPVGARCPKDRGGCGKVRKLPRAAVTAAGSAGLPGATWDPPSEPHQPSPAAAPCPDCGGPVKIEPRGITRWCPACPVLVTPPGVLVPYARGAEVTRAAKSQRERDDDAKKTVLIAGEFLRQVRAMLDDPQVHPASADLLGWYEEEITEARKARDGRRLAELAGEFAADQEARAFRRRHWWQEQPAAITTGYDDDTDDGDYDVEDLADEPAALALATPASIAAQQHRAQPQRATWAEALAVCGWRIAPAHGACQVIDEHGHHCTGATGSPPIVDALGRHAWLCVPHYGTLGRLIMETNRSRGVA